ncbi:MAG: pilus assembly protein FimV [Cryomorphaceae bacterium]|jgi:pilus assembly protein FimV
MANRLKVFANPTLANFKLAGITALVLFASAELSALGLGTLEVQSNLDEPLRGVIELRTSRGDDIDSVRASIASSADFENLGIDYPSYLGDISLSVERDGSSMILRVNSADVIIKEPFIHFLVRVDWTGGSFLREYTALIDPPVYAAQAPTLLAEPKLVGTDQSYATGTIDSYDIDAVDESEIVDSEISDPEPIYGEEPVANQEPAVAEPSYDDTPTNTDSDEYYEPEAVSDAVTEGSSSQGSDSILVTQSTDAQYGPVTSGESLSVIAQELQRQFPDLSIYQIMQVMFEENQGSFISGNINGLIMGSILNIADLNVIRAVDVEQSKIFFRNQLREWDPSLLVSRESDAIKVGQDEYSFESDSFSSDSDDDSVFSSSGSAAVDNFQVGSSGTTDSFVSDGAGDTSAGEVVALRQQITELQTSLASGSIENQELTERISILEGQLADMNRLMNLSIEDADLANVEATLAAQNNAGADLSADTSGDEFYDVAEFENLGTAETVVDSEFVDSLLEEAGAGGANTDLASDQSSDGVEAMTDVADASSTALALSKAAPVSAKPTSAPAKPEPGFMQKISNFLFADGMWKILAGIGALLVGGIVLLIMRRRRADEEFEISMMSIETNSQSIDDHSSVSASMSASLSQPSVGKDDEGPDKETSFLTVYSDSDAVVQADEVDPIAEADVYIAYGRDEQAEEVLLDGVTGNPERYDIKHKLLGLYHKNQNAEGFERVAEELYSQRQQLPAEVWQDVCKMGKEVAADNPLFDLSPDDFAAASLVNDSVPESSLVEQKLEEVEEIEPVGQEATSKVQNAVEKISVMGDNVEYQIDEIEDPSEAIGNALDGDNDNSIHLINFDDGRSQISELDEVEIDALNLDGEDGESLLELVASDSVEIDLSDELEVDSVELDNSPTLVEHSFDSDDSEERSLRDVQEVSDMEIDADYDEARTQYELAKVFVDLGDEDGARKILNDIVENSDNSVEVLTDANALLAAIA